MAFLPLLLQYKWIILFYLLVLVFLYVKRAKLDVQAKVIVLYRTLFGLRFIEKIAERHREWVRLFGYIGVGIGFVGAVIISLSIIISFVQLFTRPEQASGVSLVLPGIEIPGLGVLPFWHWLLAIFVIALVHEFAHGIVARAHGLGVHSTGLVLLGPIIGAFVEPDEKRLAGSSDIVQYSVYAAGAFANILLAVAAFFLLSILIVPAQQKLVEPVGVTFDGYYNGSYPLERAGIAPGMVITTLNGVGVTTSLDLVRALSHISPNTSIQLGASSGVPSLTGARLGEVPIAVLETPIGPVRTINVTAAQSPTDPQQAFLGADTVRTVYSLKDNRFALLNRLVLIVAEFFRWLSILSLGIGLFNLLPLPIVDGGKMLQTFLKRLWGEQRGNARYGKVALFFLLILLFTFVVSFFR